MDILGKYTQKQEENILYPPKVEHLRLIYLKCLKICNVSPNFFFFFGHYVKRICYLGWLACKKCTMP
jgi:hypothetical protein